jgi:hypothetical protein
MLVEGGLDVSKGKIFGRDKKSKNQIDSDQRMKETQKKEAKSNDH